MFGISFLSPLFLIGAAAVAVPIAIHLFYRRAEPVIEFAAMRYLRQAPVEQAAAVGCVSLPARAAGCCVDVAGLGLCAAATFPVLLRPSTALRRRSRRYVGQHERAGPVRTGARTRRGRGA